jgi:Tol biopolymer transport system component
MTWRHSVLVLIALVACSHGEPFGVTDHSLDDPFSATPPIRLTYNDGDDRTPSWLPDGSGVLYSSERLDAVDHDRCLLEMPAGGGTVRRTICERAVAHEDSTDRFESPAVSASGRIVFLRAVSTIGLQKGPNLHLMLGSAENPAGAAPVLPVPYFAPSQKTHYYLAQPHWLSADRFVYVAQDKFYQGSTFYPDTFTTGLELVRAEVVDDAVSLSVIPGTEYASSVAPGGDEDTIVFTLGGDSKVYRQSLSTGERSVIHDFGFAGIARDVQLRGNSLVAVVGRSVLFQFEDAHGWVQRDEGGDLHVVDLGTGQGFAVSRAETLFRRPTLSPDGRHIVVEASPFAPVHVGPDSEFNAPNHRPDLWLFDLQ